MDLAHELSYHYRSHRKSNVSILVLVDLAHEFVICNQEEAGNIGFNPCFSGSCSRIVTASTPMNVLLVSILVLVDLAHEFSVKAATAARLFCFNPCFSGSCSRIGQKFPLFG